MITTIVVGFYPSGVAITPDSTRAYVTNQASGNVSVINTATNTVTATIPTSGSCPFGIVITTPASTGGGTTAANVSVSGRVLSSRSRGISNAVVHLINQNGEIKTARTNRFGYYTFQGIEVGESCIFNVYAKRYQFSSQVINLTEDLAELDFTAQ